MKAIIDGLIIALFIITNYTSVCVLIALSPASTFLGVLTLVLVFMGRIAYVG